MALQLWELDWILIGWFLKFSVQLLSIIVIIRRDNFVYHYWGCTWIFNHCLIPLDVYRNLNFVWVKCALLVSNKFNINPLIFFFTRGKICKGFPLKMSDFFLHMLSFVAKLLYILLSEYERMYVHVDSSKSIWGGGKRLFSLTYKKLHCEWELCRSSG